MRVACGKYLRPSYSFPNIAVILSCGTRQHNPTDGIIVPSRLILVIKSMHMEHLASKHRTMPSGWLCRNAANSAAVFILVYLAGNVRDIAAQPSDCSIPPACQSHRECMFGTLDKYDAIFKYMINKTGCTTCNTDCDCRCQSEATPGSEIYDYILQSSYCDASPICSDSRTHTVLNYPTDKLPCETGFEQMQKSFIRLCGHTNGACCDGNCTTQSSITQPKMPCEDIRGSPPHTRWIASAYLILSLLFAQWGMSAVASI